MQNIDKHTKTRRSNRINIMMENATENAAENATENATEEAKGNVTVSSFERNSECLMKNEQIQIIKTKVCEEICLPNVDC